MGTSEKTAILVISFGTSYEETRKKTIEQIESDLHHAFPEYPLYRAWTSPRIRAKLRKRDGIHIMDIDEAMTQLKADGIRNVVVQPTYVITGFESDAMKENKYDNSDFFSQYSQMSRSVEGLKGAGEWHVLQKMLPDFAGKRVLDLGCGFGWHCVYAIEHGATHVTGIDISKKMLEEARKRNPSPFIEY